MKTTKTRRESGRSYNQFYDPEIGAYNVQYWDDWNDHRDGMRDGYGKDKTRITRVKESDKQKIPKKHVVKSYFTNKLIEYYDDVFERINRYNNKNKRWLEIRHAMKQRRQFF